ncbi:Asp23/Gls24 family envelope stress response protein [Arthrobacter sp. Sa2CUA1]|uniref:Asp23/Gls24 family envelope stress response protein n=1 Tax=Arthrobacter gallicola TaxID=2762225 RepID=A0ABR8URM9_9MICC|nr:Asp23/Gls24 family envelope stress response protein [Arthrobacter gallicola]
MDDAQNTPGSGPADPGAQPASPLPSRGGTPAVPPAPATAVPVPAAPVSAGSVSAAPDAASAPAPAAASSAAGGRTAISEQAVAKVAAIAARAVPGVHALGSGGGRTLGAVRDAVAGSDSSATAGVHVEVGETEAAVDITLVAEYGVPLTGIADSVRQAVYTAVENLVGLNVVEVNVSIADVHIPDAAENRGVKRPSGVTNQE